ncbi:DUF58 domain-containing protein [Candidatus Gracilibacteria bacterium]|nr:DUF58 domain-containing protein [Candidatus Gracilibacteria bacterium]
MKKVHIQIQSKKNIGTELLGKFRSVFLGHGIEFRDFREYSNGDDAKYIDWVASSKEQTLIMRRFQEERDGILQLIIDESESLFYENNQLKNQLKNQLVKLIIQASLYSGMKLTAWQLGEKRRDMVYHKNTRITQKKLLQNYKGVFRSDSQLSLKEFVEKKQKRAIYVIISDSLDIEEKSLKALSQLHDVIYLHISSSFENTLKGDGLQSLLGETRYFLDLDNESHKNTYQTRRIKELGDFKRKLHSYKIRVGIFETGEDPVREIIKTLDTHF